MHYQQTACNKILEFPVNCLKDETTKNISSFFSQETSFDKLNSIIHKNLSFKMTRLKKLREILIVLKHSTELFPPYKIMFKKNLLRLLVF